MRNNFLIGLIALLVVPYVFAATEIVNKEELRSRLGTAAIKAGDLSQVKIAILDNGFRGFEAGKGMLPDSAELIDGPLNTPSSSNHGLGMAQIAWAVSGQSAAGPKMYLVNTNGFTNFRAAVDFVIEKKVDIVLYSQIWLFGSNFDGKGFINEVVNRATSQGVIWINAAGNLGGHVASAKVKSNSQSFNINNKLDENNFTVTLTWNDFSESEKICSKKDLDLQILDASDRVVFASELIQKGEAPNTKDPSDHRSCYARETISVSNLENGTYKARVVVKSDNFSDSDSFRIIITDDRPESLEFTDRTFGSEIMPPADNSSVLTVGDKSKLSSVGPTADGRIKPDFLIEDSKVSFSNGNQSSGSSNAAAMVAGAVALLKSYKSDLTLSQLQTHARSLKVKYLIPGDVRSLQTVPEWVKKLVPVGGVAKIQADTKRIVILSKELPLELALLKPFNLRLQKKNDIIACSELMNSCQVYPLYQDLQIGPPLIEFRQFTLEGVSAAGAWRFPVNL